jgi:hypothetical protein
MNQSLYAHMNNKRKKKEGREEDLCRRKDRKTALKAK